MNPRTAPQEHYRHGSRCVLPDSSPHVSIGLAAAAVVLLGLLASQWGVLELQVHAVEERATADAGGVVAVQGAQGCGRLALRIAEHVIRQAPCLSGAPAQRASAGVH